MSYKQKARKITYPSLEVNVRELPNGIRVVHKYVPYSLTVHCGYVLNTGSRDDGTTMMGLAHFIEHSIFKGTKKRKTFHILNYLESVGGDLNAYTTKENTCVYASMPSIYADRAAELLTDIIFHSTFPEKEIEKERQVIVEEIDMYRNAPEEAIFEDFDEMVFPGHALGHPILGTKESINKIDRDAMLGFLQKGYTAGNVVFAMVGNITEAQLDRIINKYLIDQVLPTATLERVAPVPQQPLIQESKIPFNQAHEIIGGRAYPVREDKYYPFILLTNMLGGPASNSRLNLNIREKYGLAYSISTFYNSYQDAGLWGIYYACDNANLKRVRRLVEKELAVARTQKLSSNRLHQVKKQLIGQFTLSYENLLSQMLGLAKDILDFGEIQPFSDYVERMEAVTAEDMLETANEVFDEKELSRLSYLPEEEI
jgi:predicted Zn-dependent peptidase